MSKQEQEQKCQLFDAQTLGQRLSLSKRQIFRLKSCGKIPAPVKIGGSVRWIESEIDQWIQAGAPDRETWEAIRQMKEK